MNIRIVHDKEEVDRFLTSKNTYDYMYQINNLDGREWSKVICYGLYNQDELLQIAMLYIGYDIPVLLGASYDKNDYNKKLIKAIKSYLPSELYTHMDRETLYYVFDRYELDDVEEYVNMGIENSVDISFLDRKNTVRLDGSYYKKINKLFNENYPENCLDRNLLDLNDNYGVVKDDKLLSFAGVHAYSLEYKIASIAHVTTDKNSRNSGFARDCVVALLKDLRSKVDYVGLNVKTGNLPAIKCYKNIGFKEYGRFIACDVKINTF